MEFETKEENASDIIFTFSAAVAGENIDPLQSEAGVGDCETGPGRGHGDMGHGDMGRVLMGGEGVLPPMGVETVEVMLRGETKSDRGLVLVFRYV